jgi:glutamate synthase (NADPH/NADH) small chain
MAASFPLPEERAELDLPDKKPLMIWAEAKTEADRCLYCTDAPCTKACPTEIDVPTFIKKIATSNIRGSAKTIFEQNILGYSCARVCPTEVLCEGACVYMGWQHKPIAIGRLQRYATENALGSGGLTLNAKPATGKKVALIGAGPASIACAAYLALEGHESVIFEKRPIPGGLNTTGVAPYKMHAHDAMREVEWVLSLGRVKVETGKSVGTDIKPDDLLAKYDAVFLGLGLGEDTKLGIPGEDGPGVVGATVWIEQMKTEKQKSKLGGRVIVVGGGNTAIDVARECALLGADEVTMVYRRGTGDMSGYHHEMEKGRTEGVRLLTNLVPVAVVRDAKNHVTALRVAKAENGKAVAGTEQEIPCDLIALAIGQAKLRDVAKLFKGVALDKRGCIQADTATGVTGNPKVYAGGDCVNGGKEVVNAVAEGRNAARAMMKGWSK